ncbi:MAG: hypothetical protein ACRERU_11555 [Methylococcales bacterium]
MFGKNSIDPLSDFSFNTPPSGPATGLRAVLLGAFVSAVVVGVAYLVLSPRTPAAYRLAKS